MRSQYALSFARKPTCGAAIRRRPLEATTLGRRADSACAFWGLMPPAKLVPRRFCIVKVEAKRKAPSRHVHCRFERRAYGDQEKESSTQRSQAQQGNRGSAQAPADPQGCASCPQGG